MNFTEEQKKKLVEAYKKVKPEEYERSMKELSDEELKNVGGGVETGMLGLDGFLKSSGLNKFFDNIYNKYFAEVEGPKTNLVQCPFCNLPFSPNQVRDHVINNHAEEIIKNSPIF